MCLITLIYDWTLCIYFWVPMAVMAGLLKGFVANVGFLSNFCYILSNSISLLISES